MELLIALSQRMRQAIAANGDGGAAVTVGDVYQRLIPYRTVRDELGILEFAAYEHALLRLLSGEGGHLAVLDPQALEEIQRELASTNPILGIYRDYSESAVTIVNGDLEFPLRTASPTISPGAGEAPPLAPVERDGGAELRPLPGSPPAFPPAERFAPSPQTSVCRNCEQPLPQIDSLLYCPFCGESQGPQPCPACAAPIESAWNFCVRCGAERDA